MYVLTVRDIIMHRECKKSAIVVLFSTTVDISEGTSGTHGQERGQGADSQSPLQSHCFWRLLQSGMCANHIY